MRWERDWLYGLVFAKVRRLWDTMAEEGRGTSGPAPDHLVISQFADVSGTPYDMGPPGETSSKSLAATYHEPIVRTWRFDDTGPRLIAPPVPTRQPLAVRGMFHEVGSVSFAIRTDRRLVAFGYLVGPRYARHGAFSVKGQGKRGRLEPHPGFIQLIS